MITKKKRHRHPACLFAVAKRSWYGRLTFSATQLRSRTLTPGLRKRAAHRRSNGVRLGVWRRGGGDEAALEPARVCLPNAAQKYAAFLGPLTSVRLLSPPVLSKIAFRRTCWEPEKRQIRFFLASFDRTFRRRLFRGTEAPRPLVPDQLRPPQRRDRHQITGLLIRVQLCWHYGALFCVMHTCF